ncbi:response regulator transcription factor [Kitasatospora sp. NPDC053057]|uniref:response regulator transcription factor n=1 Tax=Kitasatospora sp. NPDC053057 TaxID=3364062 RepID=UPI0037C6F518
MTRPPSSTVRRSWRVGAGRAARCSAGRITALLAGAKMREAGQLFPDLTAREAEVLDLVARGYDNRRIARELVVAEKTVRNHVTHIFEKLHVATRAEAVARARDMGLGEG